MASRRHQLSIAARVLSLSDPTEKCATALGNTAYWPKLGPDGVFKPPAMPAKPDRPELKPPTEVPKRRLGNEAGRFALLHAIAHIEYNAINLAFDMALRFADEIDQLGLNADDFVNDWSKVGQDEARHFEMVNVRLSELGGAYGDLPAHDGLWDAAKSTEDTVTARLAVAPLVLEARGLDVTPGMIKKLTSVGDIPSAEVLGVIYREEIGHVEVGTKWFNRVCQAMGQDVEETFKVIVKQRFRGILKPPFNVEARTEAGLPQQFYSDDIVPV